MDFLESILILAAENYSPGNIFINFLPYNIYFKKDFYICTIENVENDKINLKKWRFQLGKMTIEKVKPRKISSVEDLQKYLVCIALCSEIYVALPEKY